jgi:hypothetical protein
MTYAWLNLHFSGNRILISCDSVTAIYVNTDSYPQNYKTVIVSDSKTFLVDEDIDTILNAMSEAGNEQTMRLFK